MAGIRQSASFSFSGSLECAGPFSEATQAGSLLVCVVTATLTTGIFGFKAPTFPLPQTEGFEWELACSVTSPKTDSGSPVKYYYEFVGIYYIENAASMPATTFVTYGGGVVFLGVALAGTLNLLEIPGCAQAGVIDTAVSASSPDTTQSPASAGGLVANVTDLIIAAVANPLYSGYTAGSGFTLVAPGIEAILNALPGTYQAEFGPSTGQTGPWACAAVAFKVFSPPPPTPSGMTPVMVLGSTDGYVYVIGKLGA